MYIDVVPNRRSPPAILLRESYRDGNQVRKRTLLNLTSWPRHLVEGFRALLNGGSVIPAGQEALTIVRSLPHGHVAAVLGTLRHIGLDRLLGPDGNRCRDLAIAAPTAARCRRDRHQGRRLSGARSVVIDGADDDEIETEV